MEVCRACAPGEQLRAFRSREWALLVQCLQSASPAGIRPSRKPFFFPFLKSILFSLIPSGQVSFVMPLYILHIALGFKKYRRPNIGTCLSPFILFQQEKENFKETPVNGPSLTVLCLLGHHRRFGPSAASITPTLGITRGDATHGL